MISILIYLLKKGQLHFYERKIDSKNKFLFKVQKQQESNQNFLKEKYQ